MAITETITWKLLRPDSEVSVTSTVFWTPETPLDLRIAFHVGLPEPVEWLFSRDLFYQAFNTPGIAGFGDVKVMVFHGQITLNLSSPFGEAAFRTDANQVSEFMQRTYAEIAIGSEVIAVPDDVSSLAP